MNKVTASDMEIEVARYFNMRTNLIVPNVSWGMLNHEADLVVVSPSGIASEVEIKVSKHDLKIDRLKRHHHNSKYIHRLFFAIPDYLQDAIEFIPEHAGILVVRSSDAGTISLKYRRESTKLLRPAKLNKHNPKWTEKEKIQLLRLSTMRIWSLKEKLNKQLKQRQELK